MRRLFPTLVAVAAFATPLSAAAILFGPSDDRRPFDEAESAWIGVVATGAADGSWGRCTGALVGRAEVLTNAHCILSEDGAPAGGDIRYYPNLPDDPAWIEVGAYFVGEGDRARLENDWAILRLDKPFPTAHGYFDILVLDDWSFLFLSGSALLDEAGDARLLAYHRDLDDGSVLMESVDCGVRGIPEGDAILASGRIVGGGTFFHDCDAAGISSGGPLVVDRSGRAVIVGIQSTFALPPNADPDDPQSFDVLGGTVNIGVRAGRFADFVAAHRTE